MKECPKCGGTGKVHDDRVVGAKLRKKREGVAVSLRECAGRMGISASYLCDLEHGRRNWTNDLQQKYLAAIGA